MSGEYVAIIVDDLPEERRVEICRIGMEITRHLVTSAECDIPWEGRNEFPPKVLAAAEHLRTHFVAPRKRDQDYLQTGIIPVDDDTWAHLLIFAPYAYDVTCWSETGIDVISLADEATSIVLWLSSSDQEALARIIGNERLQPLASR